MSYHQYHLQGSRVRLSRDSRTIRVWLQQYRDFGNEDVPAQVLQPEDIFDILNKGKGTVYAYAPHDGTSYKLTKQGSDILLHENDFLAMTLDKLDLMSCQKFSLTTLYDERIIMQKWKDVFEVVLLFSK